MAVYREVFETILFFEAITSQAGPAGLRSVVLGALAGVLAITALAVGAFRFGLQLPRNWQGDAPHAGSQLILQIAHGHLDRERHERLPPSCASSR